MNKKMTIEDFYPLDDEEKQLMKRSPIWQMIEDYIEDLYELEASLFVDQKELEAMKIRAFANYDLVLTESATRGDQEAQGKEYAFSEIVDICDGFFKGILLKKE